MSDATTAASSDRTALLEKLISASEKTQLTTVATLGQQEPDGILVLVDWLRQIDRTKPPLAAGSAYLAVKKSSLPAAVSFVAAEMPTGVVVWQSAAGIDYQPLQDLLIAGDLEAADRETTIKLCELAGEGAIARKWIYFTEVESFPVAELQTIDFLWRTYSAAKFGFSIQRELWVGVGKNWDRLWPKIGWKEGISFTRYPGGFTWNLDAPRGHLPLSNQLRGVRVMAALMDHPAFK
jgi:hypothetical protein